MYNNVLQSVTQQSLVVKCIFIELMVPKVLSKNKIRIKTLNLLCSLRYISCTVEKNKY